MITSPSIALIVGDGPEKSNLKELIASYELDDNVVLCGEIKDMASIYDYTDLVVIPSLTEGLPYVLLEAMAWKIPILAVLN